MRRYYLYFVVLLLSSWTFTGCKTPVEKAATIIGGVTARPPIVLPAEAGLEIKLVDNSPFITAPQVLAQTVLSGPRSMPIPYQLTYSPRLLQPGHQYVVQFSITLADKPWYIAESVNHFVHYGRILRADAIMRPIR